MRISTAGMHNAAVDVILRQQTALARTQEQLATGRRVTTPADDPIAAVRIQDLERLKSASEQYGKNSDLARNRLSLEEQALADTSNLLQRVRELIVKASNTGTMSNEDRKSIAVEVEGRLTDLMEIANRKDGGGEYLFAGYSTQTRPFTRPPGGVVGYAGDQNSRLLQISSSQSIADSHTGAELFMGITEGNGVFVVKPSNANTGSAIVGTHEVVDRAAWTPGDYTLTFTTATDWQITDSTSAVVANGTYEDGAAITFDGVQFSLSGTPAVGDTFAIDQAGTVDAFALLEDIRDVLQSAPTNPAEMARLTSALGGHLQQLDQTLDHVSVARSEVGSRLSALDVADTVRTDLDLETETALSKLRDLDYAEAIARMNRQMVGLQAAQSSYARIAQLSLFDYL